MIHNDIYCALKTLDLKSMRAKIPTGKSEKTLDKGFFMAYINVQFSGMHIRSTWDFLSWADIFLKKCPQTKDLQFTVAENKRNQIIFTI